MKKSYKKIISSSSGITLIALIVTIIVLLILAGISIGVLKDDHNIIDNAKEATSDTNYENANEKVSLAQVKSYNNNGTLDLKKLKDNLQEIGTISKGDNFPVKAIVDGFLFTIYQDGTIKNDEITSSSIYVFLYDDGTLSFGSKNDPIAGKKVLKEYGNIQDKAFTSWQDADKTKHCTTPWYDDRLNIKSVTMVDNISPKSMSNWFFGCSNLTSIDNLSKIDSALLTDTSYLFYDCTGLITLNLSNFDVSNVTTMQAMFYNCTNLESLNLDNFNTRNLTTMYIMFSNCNSLKSLNLKSFDTSKVTNMSYTFFNCYNLTNINLSSFDTSNVTTMKTMFHNCFKLKSLDVSSFDTSNVNDMSNMFRGGNNGTMGLIEIKGLENFNTSKVTNMYAMFYNCPNLTSLDLSSFDTSNVTDMSWMFAGGGSLSMNLAEIKGLENFNTSKVTNLQSMFYNCIKLSTLNLSSFNTSNVTDMSWMFAGGGSLYMNLTEIKGLESFNTGKVTNMNSMFQSCYKFTSLDLSSFDTSNVQYMSKMFINTTNMQVIYVGSKWTMENVEDDTDMFDGSGVSGTTLK